MIRSVHFLYGIRSGSITPEDAIDKMVRVGAEAVELPVDPFLEDDGQRIIDVKKYADSRNVEVIFSTGLPPAFDMASDDSEVRKAGQEHMRKILHVMDKGGIPFIGGTISTCWPSYRTQVLTDQGKQSILERTAECFGEAIKNAPEMGIELAIEPVNRFEGFLYNTSKEATDFCEMVGNPNLGVMLDGFHMSVEEHSITEAVKYAGRRLIHLHCAENNRALPGTGAFFNWKEFFDALKETGYKGRFGIESFTVAGGEVSASIALWRDLSNNATEEKLEKDLAASLAFLKENY